MTHYSFWTVLRFRANVLTFGNEGAVPAEGRVFAWGGVTAKQGLWFIGEEAFGTVHRRLLHACAAGPAHAPTTVATAANAAGRLEWLVDGTEALAYIHWGHQLVDVKLDRHREMGGCESEEEYIITKNGNTKQQ